MRVAIYNGPDKPIAIERVPDPEPGADELVVKIGRCGICGSDIAMTSGGPFSYPAGCRLGHEYAGEVVAVGRDIAGVKIGDRVACIPSAGCGHCAACRDGQYLICATARPLFGGFGDYVAVPRGSAVLLPRSLSLSDGALVEPVACGLHALRLAGMRCGDRVMVLGAGSIAAAMVYWARALGAAKIAVASRSAHRRETLIMMGADAVHGFDEDGSQAFVEALGGMPDIVAECVGQPGALGKAIAHVRPGGTVLSMGMCAQSEPMIAALCAFKGVTLRFPLGYSIDEFAETARKFDADAIKPEFMVGEIIPLNELPVTLENMRQGAQRLKIHVDPGLE